MEATPRYTPGMPPRVASERKGMLPITNPSYVPASVYRDAVLPELPTPQRKGIIEEWFTLSTHILPAAFPRSGPDVPYPEGCDADGLIVPKVEGGPAAVKEAEKETGIKVRKALFEISKKHWLGGLPGHNEKPFWVCVNRFVRKVPVSKEQQKGRKRVTLFLVHGNGLGKECWEPVLMHALLNTRGDDPIIDEIWSWDAVSQGDSSLINKQNLGALHEWLDSSRDIINFLTYYLPDTIGYLGDELPTHLPLIPQDISHRRATDGLKNRTLISVGYSFGGCTLTHAARFFPELFPALVLIDPAIIPVPISPGMIWADGWGATESLVAICDSAVSRRNGWESKAKALQFFKGIPFCATWNPLSLELYVECQLWEDKKTGDIRLKTSGVWETAVFAGNRGPFEAWDTLPLLDDRVALRFIMPEKPLPDVSSEHLPFLRPRNSSHVIIKGATHLLCHEVPFDTGDEILSFLRNEYGSTCRAKL